MSTNLFTMEAKERAALKAAIMQNLSAEVDKWLDQQPTLRSGYEYETAFTKVAQRVNRILLEKGLGEPPRSRNDKKKSKPALGK